MTKPYPAVMRCVFALSAALGVCAPAAAAPSSIDACLPFTMPDSAALFGSSKKVFATISTRFHSR